MEGAGAYVATVSTVAKLAKVGRIAGPAGFVVGELADVVAVYNGYITPTHGVANLTAGVAAFVPILAPFSIIYFGVDAFYPGGVGGIVNNVSNYQYNQAHANDPPPAYQNTDLEDMPGWNR